MDRSEKPSPLALLSRVREAQRLAAGRRWGEAQRAHERAEERLSESQRALSKFDSEIHAMRRRETERLESGAGTVADFARWQSFEQRARDERAALEQEVHRARAEWNDVRRAWDQARKELEEIRAKERVVVDELDRVAEAERRRAEGAEEEEMGEGWAEAHRRRLP